MAFNPHLLDQIFALLFDEIHRRTRRQVFLLLEDVHWADRLIPDILRGLFENARRGFAVLLTCYPEFRPRLDIALELPGLRLREISLDRLSLEQTALICREVVSKDRLTPSRLAEIYEHTGGSPFLLQEFLRFCDAEDWSDKLAKSLHEVVNRRILSLSDEEANLLDCVAIFSGEASFDALKYLSELDDARLIRLYEKLHQKGLLYDRPDGESFAVLFRYPLIKKQIVSAMLGVKRWNLHRRLTGYLRRYVTQHGSPACLDERKLSLLAWHARQAGDSLTELDARIRELKAHFVFTHELFPMLSDADLTRPPKLTTDIGFIEARLREIRSLLDRVVRASGRPPGFHAFERAILTIEGGRLRWSGDYAGAQSCLDEALKLAHFSAEGEAAAVEVLEQFCYLGIQKDDPVLLRQYVFLFYRAAMRAHMSPQVGMALRFLAVLAIMEGRCDDAVKVLNMSIRLFEKLEARGDGYTLSIIAAIHYHGDVAVHRGNHEEALSHYRQCVKLCESRGFYRGLGLHLAKSAWCAARLGKVDRMREYLAFARPLFEGLQSRPGAGMCGGEIVLDLSALLDVLDGELERAAQYLRQAGDLSRIMHKPLWNAIHFCILALLKEREEPVLAPVLTEDTRHYLGEARTRFERLGLLHELEAFDQLRELMRGRQESQCL
jgi:tetratricopeptide (TPR) repeat protein